MDEMNDSADLFANSSAETVKENTDYLKFLANVREPKEIDNNQVFTSSPFSPNTNFSFVANQFISEACNVPINLFCPFCDFFCHFEFIFKDHVKNTHPSEIMKIAQSNCFYVEFHACPFCHAKFYNKDLLPKHVLTKHEDSVMFKGLGQNDFAQCRFCSFKILRRHTKRLLMHIKKKHMSDLDHFLKQQNTSVTLSTKDVQFFCDDVKNEVVEGSVCVNKAYNQQNMTKVSEVKSILKSPSRHGSNPSNCYLNLDGDASTPNNGSYEAVRLQNSARRKLRFDIPESLNEDKENELPPIGNSPKKSRKVRWFSLFKTEKRQANHLGSPNFKPLVSPPKTPCDKTTSFFTKFHLENDGVIFNRLATHHFKCGLCYQEYENNAELLTHLRNEHRGINLSAQYRCGACNAKFYRNSYLVRHCWFHHTPLCLKNQPQTDPIG